MSDICTNQLQVASSKNTNAVTVNINSVQIIELLMLSLAKTVRKIRVTTWFNLPVKHPLTSRREITSFKFKEFLLVIFVSALCSQRRFLAQMLTYARLFRLRHEQEDSMKLWISVINVIYIYKIKWQFIPLEYRIYKLWRNWMLLKHQKSSLFTPCCWNAYYIQKACYYLFYSCIGHVTRLPCDPWSCLKRRENLFFFFLNYLTRYQIIRWLYVTENGNLFLQLVVGVIVFISLDLGSFCLFEEYATFSRQNTIRNHFIEISRRY